MSDNIRVVAIAFFRRFDQKVLICRRGPKESGAGYWEFPGGKIDAGETEQMALGREVYEELNIQIFVDDLIYVSSHHHDYGSKRIHITLFKYFVDHLDYQLVDHDQAVWAGIDEIAQFNISPADIPFLSLL